MMTALMNVWTMFVESLHLVNGLISQCWNYADTFLNRSLECELKLVLKWGNFEPSQVTPSLTRPLNGLHVLASSKHGGSVETNKPYCIPQNTENHKFDTVAVTIRQLHCFCEERTIEIHRNSRIVAVLAWFRSRSKNAKTIAREMAAIVGEKTAIVGEKTAIAGEKTPLTGNWRTGRKNKFHLSNFLHSHWIQLVCASTG